jgi:hypothetical protein
VSGLTCRRTHEAVKPQALGVEGEEEEEAYLPRELPLAPEAPARQRLGRGGREGQSRGGEEEEEGRPEHPEEGLPTDRGAAQQTFSHQRPQRKRNHPPERTCGA